MSKILIVDDIEQNRYLLQTILAAEGHETTEAVNGSEALEAARRERPDLIISDILMPQMDGFALCRECKSDETLRDIPFVFYTATYTDPRDRDLGLRLGAARFIVKPVEGEEFAAIVREVLEEYAAGNLSASPPPAQEETVFYRLYNEALVRKLEEKMLDLEKTNRALEAEIRERKRKEAELAASERRFRAMTEKVSDTIALLDAEGKLTYRSEAGRRLFGHADEEVLGNSAFDMVHPDDLPRVTKLFAQLAASPRQSITAEFRYQRKEADWLYVEASATNLLDDHDIGAIVLNYRDITERKLAERRIERQVSHLNALRDIDAVITSSFDLRLNLEQIVRHAARELKMDAADILLLTPGLNTLEYAAGHGFHSQSVRRVSLRIGEGYAGRVALSHKIVSVTNLTAHPDHPSRAALLADEGFAFYCCAPLIAKGVFQGTLEVFRRSPYDPDREWFDFLGALAGQSAIAIENAKSYEQLQVSNANLTLAYDATIEGWSRAMDLRDEETEGHTRRVTELTLKLAKAAGINDERLLNIKRGALLHDIGKRGVPDAILLKPGKLTDQEWEIMRKHPQFAYDMLAPIAYLRPALEIPYCHHEKWDGTGYPRGLKGEDIPLAARIFALVDVWDAVTSDRPYRRAWSLEKALEYISEQRGKFFDPRLTDLFLSTR